MFQNYMRRLFWLILGVAVSSIGIAMMLQANVGLEPWSVLQPVSYTHLTLPTTPYV